MSKAFGIHGSTTDHGGMVISTQARSSQMGNLFLRAGDGFACPKCKIWSTLIQSNSHIIFDGKPVAYVGDKFTCGATLMPKQMHVVGDNGGNAGSSIFNQSQNNVHEKKFIEQSATKEIKEIFWSYGENFTKLDSESRHFVDMNLHVKTVNYAVGETVEITLKYEDDDILFGELRELKLKGIINSNSEVIFKNILQNKTLNLK